MEHLEIYHLTPLRFKRLREYCSREQWQQSRIQPDCDEQLLTTAMTHLLVIHNSTTSAWRQYSLQNTQKLTRIHQ